MTTRIWVQDIGKERGNHGTYVIEKVTIYQRIVRIFVDNRYFVCGFVCPGRYKYQINF